MSRLDECIDDIIICPAKMSILSLLLDRKEMSIKELNQNPNILPYSFQRHLKEIVDDEVAKIDGDVLTITPHGKKVAVTIQKTIKEFSTKSISMPIMA